MPSLSPAAQTRTRKRRTVTPRVVHPDAAGIGIGATSLGAAISHDRDPEPIRSFGTFTEDLHGLAQWLVTHGITSVAMESTGVYWIPVFQILESYGLEVHLVNARHVKNVPGRKTDVSDAEWLQYLHSVGLLRGSFRPPADVCAVRTLMRHRAELVREGAAHIQHMQKALTEMGLQLHHVLTDLSGVTGLAIVDAILKGERDPERLAALRCPGVKASHETLCKALRGDWCFEHLFTLRQARESYQHLQRQLRECDAALEGRLARLASQAAPETLPKTARHTKATPSKNAVELPHTDLQRECYRILGVDATQVPGMGPSTVLALIGELGADLSAFPRGRHFTSWMAVCPHPKVSGGRVLRRGTRDVKHRVATHFRVSAQSLARSDCALGAFYRRMKAKLGPPQAITATAHKLARSYYHLVTTKEAYDESIFAKQEARHQQRRLERLKRDAAAFGMQLIPETAAASGFGTVCTTQVYA